MKTVFAIICLSWICFCTLQRFAEGACPVGWKSYQDACYASSSTADNFNNGESYCVLLGGHLASIHSAEELNAIKGILSSGSSYFIGLYINTRGFWQYTDGTPVDYFNWNLGQPSRQANEACTLMDTNGMWFDDSCSASCNAICKKDIGCSLPFTLEFHLNVDPVLLVYDNDVTITYYCDEGYYLKGESSATCTDGEFDPPDAPECVEKVQCYSWRDAVCDQSSLNCDTSGNTERTVETCDEPVQQCFVYHYTIEGFFGESLDATSGGCVTNNDLMLSYGCYERSYLQEIDSSGYDELWQQEEDLDGSSDDVNVCVCDRDNCNESVETAERNDAITSDPKFLLILTGIISIHAWQI